MGKVFDQPSTSSSLVLSGLSWVIVFGALQIGAPFFRSNEIRTILGGLVGSLLFFFFITFVGNLKKEIRWIEAIISLVITFIVTSSVHRVSGTTSVLFSLGVLYYINNQSKSINDRLEEATKPHRK
ncbi:hypothetical protein PPL_08461 [Heterostelium album PN500]|uniref:Dolichyl-diphosphooligosaccharide--protein glycosyltransferase subunit KCP2 n=1 Tax=Heterostelium pallidum (strain ATCC 26659 / Pp 5 / PN500) TaxID=670386 RepID=D3BI93_HETP5|nr:hypothetical protein PPL_08461 [Heterostelium album PN500]EFA78993.1 hypothetical protein PPL_08461 [Heterostelium album PN500]|eukprot:XP_020431117.1 hypothetical protein PPL_08461 [Heterostelium album PN500]